MTIGQRGKEASAGQNCVKIRTYSATVGLAKVATARVYEGEHAPQVRSPWFHDFAPSFIEQVWKRDLETFSAHLRYVAFGFFIRSNNNITFVKHPRHRPDLWDVQIATLASAHIPRR